eukprot:34350-Ditylum_brightwellii.AAC.1
MRISFLNLRKLMNIKQEGEETLDGVRKRIRVTIDNLSLGGGDGVIQPNMTGTGLVNTYDTDIAEAFQDEDGFDGAFPKKVRNAYKAYIHHQSRQGGQGGQGNGGGGGRMQMGIGE